MSLLSDRRHRRPDLVRSVHHDAGVVLVRDSLGSRPALDDAVRTLRVRVRPVCADQDVVLRARRVSQLDVVSAASVGAGERLGVGVLGQVSRGAGFGGEKGAEESVEEWS